MNLEQLLHPELLNENELRRVLNEVSSCKKIVYAQQSNLLIFSEIYQSS